MTVYISEGNLFTLEHVSSYAHGCNCEGAMGKGIALQFKEKFPEMYHQYRNLCRQGKFTPGEVFAYSYGKGWVYNLATELTWRQGARLEFIEKALSRMLEMASRTGVQEIGLPAIGAGLGKLEWKDVKEVIEKTAGSFPGVTLYVVEKYRP